MRVIVNPPRAGAVLLLGIALLREVDTMRRVLIAAAIGVACGVLGLAGLGAWAGYAHGGRAHVYSAAASAEVHGYADDTDFLRHAGDREKSLGWAGLPPTSEDSQHTNMPVRMAVQRFSKRSAAVLGLRNYRIYPPLRIHAVNHAREGDDLADVLGTADPCDGTLEAQSKTGMRHAAITTQVEIPLEGLLG